MNGRSPPSSKPMEPKAGAPRAPAAVGKGLARGGSLPHASAPTAPPTPEEAAIASRRQQLYASRQQSARHASDEHDRATSSRRSAIVLPELDEADADAAAEAAPPPERRRSSPVILILGGLLGLAIVIAVIMSVVGSSQRGSPLGKLRSALLAADIELPGPGREAKLLEIDADPDVAQRALELLGDAQLAAEGSTRSSRAYRELAAELLLVHAAKLKAPPPPAATKLAAGIRAGTRPNEGDWKGLQDAWSAWLAEPGHGGAKK